MCSWDAGSPLPIAADRQPPPHKPKVILTLFVAQLIDVELSIDSYSSQDCMQLNVSFATR